LLQLLGFPTALMAVEEPKKPQNAYWIFLAESRAALTKEAGSNNGTAVGKVAGAKWKSMTAAQKAPHEKKASALKAQFEKDVEAFKAAGGVMGKRRAEKADAKKEKAGKRARKAAKDPNQPKKPQTAYWLWLGENRAALTKEAGGGSVTAVAKVAGEKWKALPEKVKAPFEKKAAELRKAYDKAMEEYKKTAGDAANDDDEDEDEESQ